MQTLTFICPHTGRTIDAGLITDSRSLMSVQPVMMHLDCPNCGMQHQFPIKSGVLSQPSYWPSMRIRQTERFVCRSEKQRRWGA